MVEKLNGTPSKTAEFFNGLLEANSFNTSSKTLFLFDNDKAGRASYRALLKNQKPEDDPRLIKGLSYVWALPFSSEFKAFIKKYNIKHEQAFFTSEFLYPAEDAASLCLELVANDNATVITEWKQCVHGSYNTSFSQSLCNEMRTAEDGTANWLFARGVPNDCKAEFADKSNKRGFKTINIDVIANKIIKTLSPVD